VTGELLSPYFFPGNEPNYWQKNPLDPKIATVTQWCPAMRSL
jgi:hypothetical protein